jgi:hypothetical protein
LLTWKYHRYLSKHAIKLASKINDEKLVINSNLKYLSEVELFPMLVAIVKAGKSELN